MTVLADAPTKPAASSFSATPLKDAFGSLISGVDAAHADADTMAKVVNAFETTGAIVLRDQKMKPEDLKRFLRHFGELEGHTLQQFTLPGHPEIYLLSNIEKDGKPIGAHNDGVGWHTDYSYKDKPVKCTMLYGVQVPAEGSDTLFADCCAAYDALPEDKREALEGLKLHHSYKYFMETREHGAMKLSPEIEAANPDVIHPLIRTHPANGRKALWPSTGTVIDVIGMEKEAGLKMLDELVEFVTQERFVHRHKWHVGDLVLWDNRCTLHTGTLFDDKKYKRLMHRMWAKGDKPY
ncbi:MAG: TauD/TfdA family dioxygenase [Pseudomonadota bacterium]